jgi:hypothetical protein
MSIHTYIMQANDYVVAYWDVIKAVLGDGAKEKEIEKFLHENSVAGGIIAILCIALNILCGHCRYRHVCIYILFSVCVCVCVYYI